MNNATTLTATRRLASYLITQQVQSAKTTHSVVAKPYIFSLNDALVSLHQSLFLKGLIHESLIYPHESLLIFEDIIQNSVHAEGLLKLNTTAKLAWQAWQNFILWECEFEENHLELEDNQAFKAWSEAYKTKLLKNNWCDQPSLAHLIIKYLSSEHFFNDICPSRKLILAGFDDLPPAYTSLIKHLESIGWQISIAENTQLNTIPVRHQFDDIDSEFHASIQWASALLADPNHTIAIIVPELPRYRLKIEKILKQYFHPLSIFEPHPVVSHYYNISAGQPLNTLPIISRALEAINNINSETQLTYREWAEKICIKLKELNWPGERKLDSVEHQAVIQWQSALELFAKLDKVFKPCFYSVAFIKLKHLVQDIPFQPQSHVVRLHILGVLEAAGQNYSHLWITGLNDNDWPAPPSPNPFLSNRMQKEKKMPHASFERELFFVENMMTRMLNAAPNIKLSHAHYEQGKKLCESHLISQYPIAPFNSNLKKQLNVSKTLFDSKKIENFNDEYGPPVTINSISGGSTTLQLQAQCPFKAFSQMRLSLQPIENENLGLSLADRGILVHHLLASIWNELMSKVNLINLNQDDLEKMIQKHVSITMKQLKTTHLNHRLKIWDTEFNRLTKLMKTWLNLEKKRSNFEVVANEVSYSLTLKNRTIKIRIDRIDKDEGNNYFVIDYKTGLINKSGVLSEDLLAPQLPLYSLVKQFPTPLGIIYGQVKQNKCQFIGYCNIKNAFPNVNEGINDWNQQIMTWTLQLEHLLEAFCSGYAKVAPHELKLCEQCHIKPLCRIKEINHV